MTKLFTNGFDCKNQDFSALPLLLVFNLIECASSGPNEHILQLADILVIRRMQEEIPLTPFSKEGIMPNI